MTIEQEIDIFVSITKDMCETFAKKRCDYGQTTTETFEKFGPVSMLVRMHDKLGRLDNVLQKDYEPLVSNERAEDTLLDLANYAIITLLELRKANMKANEAFCVAKDTTLRR